jgi:hypothetical protein
VQTAGTQSRIGPGRRSGDCDVVVDPATEAFSPGNEVKCVHPPILRPQGEHVVVAVLAGSLVGLGWGGSFGPGLWSLALRGLANAPVGPWFWEWPKNGQAPSDTRSLLWVPLRHLQWW